MSIFQNITTKEIKAVINALDLHNKAIVESSQAKINQAAGVEQPEKNANSLQMESQIQDSVSSIIAGRLKRFNKNVPLISSKDVKQVITKAMDLAESADEDSIDPKMRRSLEKTIGLIVANFIEVATSISSVYPDPYDYYQRFFETLRELAGDEKVSLSDLAGSTEILDEVTRRLYTKEQFTDQNIFTLNKILNPDFLIKKTIMPIIDLLSAGNELSDDELRDLNEMIQLQVRPEVEKFIEITKVVMLERIEEETKRIYQ